MWISSWGNKWPQSITWGWSMPKQRVIQIARSDWFGVPSVVSLGKELRACTVLGAVLLLVYGPFSLWSRCCIKLGLHSHHHLQSPLSQPANSRPISQAAQSPKPQKPAALHWPAAGGSFGAVFFQRLNSDRAVFKLGSLRVKLCGALWSIHKPSKDHDMTPAVEKISLGVSLFLSDYHPTGWSWTPACFCTNASHFCGSGWLLKLIRSN